MELRQLPLSKLVINKNNDRHGELENETAAIAWLFNKREKHMKKLATDIATTGKLFEIPLVCPQGRIFTVFDGNRRLTCIKLLDDPTRAPTNDLQNFFERLREKTSYKSPNSLLCQIETNRDEIDDTLYRRHLGTQTGIGQSTWDDRMKTTFIERTGRNTKVNTADEVEKVLVASGQLPSDKKIPRSNMNRLLSSEMFRNRVGISIVKNKLEFTHDPKIATDALARIANDMIYKRKALNKFWNRNTKNAYLDELEKEGLLPNATHRLKQLKPSSNQSNKNNKNKDSNQNSPSQNARPNQENLIPSLDYNITWTDKTRKHHEIWDELQYTLTLNKHPNAVAVLLRVLVEISVDHFIRKNPTIGVAENLPLRKKVGKVGEFLYDQNKITKKYFSDIMRVQQSENLISIETMNRFVHSSNLSPAPRDLTSLWNTLSEFVQICINE